MRLYFSTTEMSDFLCGAFLKPQSLCFLGKSNSRHATHPVLEDNGNIIFYSALINNLIPLAAAAAIWKEPHPCVTFLLAFQNLVCKLCAGFFNVL